MAIKRNGLVTRSAEGTLFKNNKRINSTYDKTITIDSTGAAALLAVAYPMGYNISTGNYGPWTAPDPTVLTVTLTGATGGTFTITVDVKPRQL